MVAVEMAMHVVIAVVAAEDAAAATLAGSSAVTVVAASFPAAPMLSTKSWPINRFLDDENDEDDVASCLLFVAGSDFFCCCCCCFFRGRRRPVSANAEPGPDLSWLGSNVRILFFLSSGEVNDAGYNIVQYLY